MMDEMMVDDFGDMMGGGGEFGGGSDYFDNKTQLKLTARHLFCLAAEGITLPKSTTLDESDDPSIHYIIKKTLGLVTEHKETLRGHDVHVWYPNKDQGSEGMLRVLNSAFEGSLTYNFDSEPAEDGQDDLYRFGTSLRNFIEPASPSWLIQNINFRCNLSEEQRSYVHPILAGVGTKHHDDNDSFTKGNTRRLATGYPISVLNLDCEGCEYNLIPSMHETSFKSIGLILGRTNWGFIPTSKKPSSERAEDTHKRVCTHYNFARRCKECCDFPTLPVRPRLPSTTVVENGEFGDADVEDEANISSQH
ncbi:hypothetical protein QTG54_007016 [Skeletonema marinoi]|uniref:Uncharacterized protein n=1 Tax=Skeletonema marinoi TaxID=267567 RepID=A0AAD9DCF8_9STRA|nr:hypothetical protein QTG54_007016 [Skeletonema marinoi]